MLYLTPLEISQNDELASTLLESFSYDEGKHLITWNVRKGIRFSDGSEITPEDVAFSVARMAYTRPLFPVIQYIEGLSEWIKRPSALESLPSGIQVTGQKIQIHLTRNVSHPLFRFCLELFSIIPKSSVDLKTNKLKKSRPLTSGYYELVSQRSEGWLFKRREGFQKIYGHNAPPQVLFQFKPATEVVALTKKLGSKAVIATNEGLFSPTEIDAIRESAEIRAAPSSRFGMLLLNPNVPPFDKKECRRAFAIVFRDELALQNLAQFQIESSIFTKILPGYLTKADLDGPNPKSSSECEKMFKGVKIEWASVRNLPNYIFETTMKRTIQRLGMAGAKFKEVETKITMTNLFFDNKIGMIPVSSGFWPLDPAGDLQMLFTPNLHKVLAFVSTNNRLQSLIQKTGSETNPKERVKLFEAVNRHLHDEALLNAYVHFRRFFIIHKTHRLNDIPLAITSAAPWQVFEQP